MNMKMKEVIELSCYVLINLILLLLTIYFLSLCYLIQRVHLEHEVGDVVVVEGVVGVEVLDIFIYFLECDFL